MIKTDQVVQAQRLLLLTKGYNRERLHVSDQPNRFLSTLSTTLAELDRDYEGVTQPVSFSHKLAADFENGRYPATMVFNYSYAVSTRDLSIKSFEAYLFDAKLSIPMKGDPHSMLPEAKKRYQGLLKKSA